MITLSIGKATYDTTVPLEVFLQENTKTVVKEKLEGSGGAACNVAYLLSKWKQDSYFAGIVGYDDCGNLIKKELEAGGVHTNFMEINYEKKTTTTFILANKQTTSRTQLTIEPETYHLKKSEFDVIPNVVYSDGYEYSATLAAFNKYQSAFSVLGAGINVADEKEIEALAKYAKYVIFSLDYACRVTKMNVDVDNPSMLLKLYEELKSRFPNSNNIVTLKKAGALYTFNNEVKVMPPMSVQEVDRTGAGDVFDGAFVYGLGKGYDLEKCIILGNIAGALSTTKYGAKNSIPLLSDVIQHYEAQFGPIDAVKEVLAPPTNDQGPTNTPQPTSNPSSSM